MVHSSLWGDFDGEHNGGGREVYSCRCHVYLSIKSKLLWLSVSIWNMLVGLKLSEDTSLKHLIKEAYFIIDYFKEYVIQHSMSMEGTVELTGDSKVGGDINWEGTSFGEEKSPT